MVRLIDKFGVAVIVNAEQAVKLEKLGYKRPEEEEKPKPQRKRTAKPKEQ